MKKEMKGHPYTLYIKIVFLYNSQTFDSKTNLCENNDAWLDDVVSGRIHDYAFFQSLIIIGFFPNFFLGKRRSGISSNKVVFCEQGREFAHKIAVYQFGFSL